MVGTGLRKDYVHELGRSHDVGFTDVVQERDAWVRESWMRADTLSRAEQLRYRYLLSLEGNDVATDLKWSKPLCGSNLVGSQNKAELLGTHA